MESLIRHLGDVLSDKIVNWEPISGGDINRALRLQTLHGQQLFVKYNEYPQGHQMLSAESEGLRTLRASGTIRIPKVYGQSSYGAIHYLVLEFISSQDMSPRVWVDFGRSLAQMHQVSQESFGFTTDNYIGRLPQSNKYYPDWANFYAQERITPQLALASARGFITPVQQKQFDQLLKRAEGQFPVEKPALLHGDLWSGNFLSTQDEAVLIDPASYFGHREMDLAMTRLFGGFDQRFYAAYREISPLAPNYEQREDLYQLYYLLVHLNLFGTGYQMSVLRILQKYSG